MRTIFATLTISILIVITTSSFHSSPSTKEHMEDSSSAINSTKIKWLSWDEAIKRNDTVPKKVFIDFYTSWCGWCKRMDSSTFKDPKVVAYMNEHFHAIKFDAEQKEDIVYKGHTFKFVNAGRRGYHELASSMLDNNMSYPSFAALSEEVKRITIIPGYRKADELLIILQYIATDKFETMTYDDYVKSL